MFFVASSTCMNLSTGESDRVETIWSCKGGNTNVADVCGLAKVQTVVKQKDLCFNQGGCILYLFAILLSQQHPTIYHQFWLSNMHYQTIPKKSTARYALIQEENIRICSTYTYIYYHINALEHAVLHGRRISVRQNSNATTYALQLAPLAVVEQEECSRERWRNQWSLRHLCLVVSKQTSRAASHKTYKIQRDLDYNKSIPGMLTQQNTKIRILTLNWR